jgi:chromosome segregation ATPase
MEYLKQALQHPFTWGLLLGILIAAFIWKNGFSAKRSIAKELRRVQEEIRDLQTHLNTQLKINASGNETLQAELADLKRQNENLRINTAALQQKPGRAEQRLLHIHESAARIMREQAPGFAPAWEKALRQAEADLDAADSGLKKLVKRVIPGLGNSSSTPASQQTLLVNDEAE